MKTCKLCFLIKFQVDVEVYLCYCTGDECNQRTIAGSANTNMLRWLYILYNDQLSTQAMRKKEEKNVNLISRLGGFVATMINYSLIAALTLVLID